MGPPLASLPVGIKLSFNGPAYAGKPGEGTPLVAGAPKPRSDEDTRERPGLFPCAPSLPAASSRPLPLHASSATRAMHSFILSYC